MRPKQVRLRALAAWLGVIALSCNALVPIQLTFGLALELADAGRCGHRASGALGVQSPGLWALAVLTAGNSAKHPSQSHKGLHRAGATVCAAAGVPTGFIELPPRALAIPRRATAACLSLAAADNPPQPALRAYRSRAPPMDLINSTI